MSPQTARYFLPVLALAALVVFSADVRLPIFWTVWLFYAPLVLASLWLSHRSWPILFSAVATLLIYLAFFLRPVADESWQQSMFHRSLDVMVLWIMAGLIVRQLHAREKLMQSESRYRLLFEEDLAGDFISTPDGRLLACNQAFARMFGFESVAEAMSTTAAAFYPDPQTRAAFLKQLRRERQLENFEAVRRRRDGTLLHVIENVVGTFDKRGELVEMRGYVFDNTERKRALEALKASERKFALLADNVPGLFSYAGSDECYRFVNKQYEKLFGLKRDEIVGRHIKDILGEDAYATAKPHIEKVLSGQQVSYEATMPLGTSGTHWMHVVYVPDIDNLGQVTGFYVVVLEMTELKRAQERALQAERLAAIGQAMTGLAHESRNALQRSQNCLEMLALRIEDRPDALQLLAEAQKSQDYLHRLYEDVREYAAPLNLRARVCDLADVVEEAWQHLLAVHEGRDAKLDQQAGEWDLRCEVDRQVLEQVFRNILENSLAACLDPTRITVRYAETHLGAEPAVQIALGDNGPGLTPEAKQKIFDPFYTTKTRGTGLGMAITKRVVEAHGGQIAVGAGGPPGAEIVLTLPRGDL